MSNKKVFIAIIDDPNIHNADFEYTVCETREVALNYLLSQMSATDEEIDESIFEDDNDLSVDEKIAFLVEKAKEDLLATDGAEFCGVYYRIVESDYLV